MPTFALGPSPGDGHHCWGSRFETALRSSLIWAAFWSLCVLQGGWIQCLWSAHLCTKAGVTCGFCTKACCGWLGATLANTVSILACHIREIYVAWVSAKSANMLCFSKSAKSLLSVTYSGNTRPFLILGMLHLSSLVSGLCIQKGCLLCLRTTLNIFIWVIIHSQMCVTWN